MPLDDKAARFHRFNANCRNSLAADVRRVAECLLAFTGICPRFRHLEFIVREAREV